MLNQFIKGRVYVFIDAANILYSQQTLGWRVDYQKLKKYFERECDLKGIFFYTGNVGENHKQGLFLEKLKSFGYQVTAKEVKRIQVGRNTYEWKGNLDVELALDAYRLMEEFDTLLLFSGDSDFSYLLDLLRQKGKKVIVASTRGHISKELLTRAKYIDLRKLKEIIIKNQKPG